MMSWAHPDGMADRGLVASLRTVVTVSRERRITLVAAGLAYYSFNSLVPFALFLFLLLGFLDRFDLLAVPVALVVRSTPAEVETLIRQVTADASGRRRLVVIAAGVFVWSTLRMFRAVHGAFGAVYETRSRETLFGRLVDTTLVFLTVLLGLVLLAGVGVALALLVGGPVWALVSPLFLLLALTAVFFPMYYTFPETPVTPTEALPGTVVAAGAWTVASVGFRVYAATTRSVELYGVAGAVLLVLTWLYVGSLALLVGAVLNAVVAGRVAPEGERA